MKTVIFSMLLSLATVFGCSSEDSFPNGEFLAGTYLGMDQYESFALVQRDEGEVRISWMHRDDDGFQVYFSDAVARVKIKYTPGEEEGEWVQLKGSKFALGERREFWAHESGELWDGVTDTPSDYLQKEISLTPWMRPVKRKVWQQEFDKFSLPKPRPERPYE